MVDLPILDAMVRGVAVGGFAAVGATLGLSPRAGPLRWVGAVFFLTAIGHTLDNCMLLKRPDGHVSDLTRALSVMGSGMFLAFALTLFDDARRLPLWRLAPPAACLVLGVGAALSPAWCAPSVWAAYNLFTMGLVVYALIFIWQGWRGDLVESRRRLRGPVMVAAATYVLVTSVQDMGANLGAHTLQAPLLQAIVLVLLAVSGAVALLQLDPLLVATPAPAPAADATRRVSADLSAGDRLALARLDEAMDREEIWRREDLSIRALADRVKLPEHRLRRLINGVLGHRNFAAFVNARRIEAAKQALRDPAQLRTPVSAIAYELGFGSLGPFNRAFKDATGMTPTVWRLNGAGEAADDPRADASPKSENPLPI